jgi:23S rRNA (pseudouridine1915-N3)-methyltransferase
MIFRLVAVGRVRDASLKTAEADFIRRISRYVTFEVRECAEGRGNPDEVKRREGDTILKALSPRETVVALTRGGGSYSSRGFADQVSKWQESARDTTFLIGGAHGLSPEVLKRADGELSLSDMTFPHELARVMFLEQLYRANTIRRGEPYHKGD